LPDYRTGRTLRSRRGRAIAIGHRIEAALPNAIGWPVSDHQPEPDPFQRRHVILLAPRIGHRQVDVDNRLGCQPRVTGNKIVRVLIMRGINVRLAGVRRVSVGAWQRGQ
jgi:hypothetical protein